MVNKTINTDVVIMGAGLVGMTAAIALAQQGHQVVLIDANQPLKKMHKDWDARIYALTELSVHWLSQIGIWRYVDNTRVNPIDAMHLWQQGQQKRLALNADDANLARMGCIVENQNLMVACWQAINKTNVNVITAQSCVHVENTSDACELTLLNNQIVKAKLLIAADGANSWVREYLNIGVQLKSFNQTAIVANYQSTHPHHNVAKQWFAPHETLALLPLPNNVVSLVWSLSTENADQLLSLTELALAKQVQDRASLFTDVLTPLNKSLSFKLTQKTALRFIDTRVVLMGDAAHQVHPMAGQGVNLGFKDVMKFANIATNVSTIQDIGDHSVLRDYERAARVDALMLNTLTSGLDALFGFNQTWVQKALQLGMQNINEMPYLKKQLIKQATL